MDIFDHPGNLGSTRGMELTILHADWPAYPQGDNFYTPLLQMTAFPPNTEFIVVDDIDESFLLVASAGTKKLDHPYDERHFHVAVWHEDLRELRNRGMIDGLEPVSARGWYERYLKRLREDGPDGAALADRNEAFGWSTPEPNLRGNHDDIGEYIIYADKRLRVTDSGRSMLLAELGKERTGFRAGVGQRVAHLFELTYYDTAIREACVQLEDEIRRYVGSDLWGNHLVEEFVSKLRREKIFLESYLRTFRQELRTVFKFIRNDFMHNLRESDEAAAHAMLYRIARARAMFNLGPE